MLDILFLGFRKCLYVNVLSFGLLFITLFSSRRILFCSLVLTTFYCLWIVINQVHRFKKIFNFDVNNLILKITSTLKEIDSAESYEILDHPEKFSIGSKIKEFILDWFRPLSWR